VSPSPDEFILAPEDGDIELFGPPVSAMQSNLVVNETTKTITGTLKFITGVFVAVSDGSIPGDGHFIALKFSGAAFDNATSIKVGITNSVSPELVEVIDNPYRNCAFKISNKDYQDFKVEVTVDGVTTSKTYSLAGLVIEDPFAGIL
jgi:hypothetical protein